MSTKQTVVKVPIKEPAVKKFVKDYENIFRDLKSKASKGELGILPVYTRAGERLTIVLKSVKVVNDGEIFFSGTFKNGTLDGTSKPNLCLVRYCTEVAPL